MKRAARKDWTVFSDICIDQTEDMIEKVPSPKKSRVIEIKPSNTDVAEKNFMKAKVNASHLKMQLDTLRMHNACDRMHTDA